MKVLIDIPEDVLKRTVFYREFRDLNDCVTTIKALEKATPLDKIRAEIMQSDIYYDNDYFSGNRDPMYKCNDVLQIIDKYR